MHFGAAHLRDKPLGDRMEKGGLFSTEAPPSLSALSLEGFRISQVQLADAGTFTCVAASPAGVADRNVTLQVHGKEQGCGIIPASGLGV